jgi:hypothetical protein
MTTRATSSSSATPASKSRSGLSSPRLADEVLGRHITTDAFTIAANFAGSKVAVQVPPTADFTITVTRQVNATGVFSTIGTIVIHH